MRKTLLIQIACLLCFALTALPNITKANHAAAGELTYQWVSGSTYKFIYKGYFDCSGTVAPTSVNLCATNTSTNTSNYHILNLWTGTIPPNSLPNCSVMPIGCYRPLTQCDSPASTVKGYKECWFSADINLADTSSNWQFTVTVNSRVAYRNIEQSNQYLLATLNNAKAQGNSSPYFNSKSVYYCCADFNTTDFKSEIIEPDGDSIVINIIQPYSNPNSSNFCPTVPVLATVKNFSPPLTFPGRPIPVKFNSFYMDTIGNIQLWPDTIGYYLITFQIKEYRSGDLIGTVLRDVLVVATDCKSVYVSKKFDESTIQGLRQFSPGTFIICQQQPINICVDIKASDTLAMIYVRDKIADTAKGAIVTYSQQGTDSIRACVMWTPQLSDSGIYPIQFISTDSTCYLPGTSQEAYHSYQLYVKQKPSITIRQYPLTVWEGLYIGFQSTILPCDKPDFQWQVNGVDVPDATKHTWGSTTLKNGDIVTCRLKCNDTLCTDTIPIVSNAITIQMAMSVKGVNEDSQLRLYPNPNNGSFAIKLNEAPARDAQLEVINTYGQVVHRQSLKEQLQTVKLTQSIPGVYLLRVINGADIYTERITVQ